MSKIDSLTIKGIRSYNSEKSVSIQFDDTLTLILGVNGSGKTTILECLKYICTGNLPSGTKMANFVNDLKISNKKEIKSKIELKFFDLNNAKCLAHRSVMTVIKKEKIETKLLQANLLREDDIGQNRNITCRAGDTIQQISHLLGASPPVIDYVILCHHDDACWPMGEPKLLKDRFDEIFATTSYNKALESVRNYRKLKAQTLKDYQLELTHLNSIHLKAVEINTRLTQTTLKHKTTLDDIEKYSSLLTPKNEEISLIVKKIGVIEELNKKISSFIVLKDHVSFQVSELRENLPDIEMTYEQTLIKLEEKTSNLASLEQEILSLDNDHTCIVNKYNQIRIKKESNNIAHALLQSRYDDIRLRIQRGYEFIDIKSFSNIINIEESGAEFKFKFKEYCKNNIELLEKFFLKNDVMKSKLDETSKTYALDFEQYNHDSACLNSKKNELKNILDKLKEIKDKILNLENIQILFNETELCIKQYNESLIEFKSESDIIDNSISINFAKLDSINLEIKSIEDLLDQLQIQFKISSDYERLNISLNKMNSDLIKIFDAHAFAFNGFVFDINTLTEKLWKQILIKNDNEILKLSELINDKHKSISHEEITLANCNKNIKEKSENLTYVKNEINEIQKEISIIYKEDLKLSFSEVVNIIEKQKIKKIKFQTLEHFYAKFLQKLNSFTDRQSTTKCPLCVREVSTVEIYDLITKLDKKVSHLVNKKQKSEETILAHDNLKNQLSSIAELTEKNKNLLLQHSELQIEIQDENLLLENIENQLIMLKSTLAVNIELKEKLDAASRDLYSGERVISEISNIRQSISQLSPKHTCQEISKMIQENQKKLSDKKLEKTNIEKLNNKYQKDLNELNNKCYKMNQILNEKHQKRAEYLMQIGSKNDYEEQNEILLLQESKLIEEIKKMTKDIEMQKIKNSAAQNIIDKLSTEYNNSVSEYNKRSNAFEFKKQQINETIIKFTEDFLNEACAEKMAKCTLKITKLNESGEFLENQLEKIKTKKTNISNEIFILNTEISQFHSYLELFKKQKELQNVINDIHMVQVELDKYESYELLKNQYNALNQELNDLKNQISHLKGFLISIKENKNELEKDLTSPLYKNSENNYENKNIQINVAGKVIKDLDDYYAALDYAITKYHSIKIKEINDIIYEYWSSTYKGDDIKTIEIRSEIDEENIKFKEKRSFNYKIVMLNDDVEIDMRGRCSAGQKMMASIIIRLALAEAFCGSCSFLALDEPTTNLDSNNIQGLADSLRKLVMKKREFGQFQLILITHDEKFLTEMCHDQLTNHYYEIFKDENGFSSIKKCPIGSCIG